MSPPLTTNPTIAIIGAGICGLTTALHLHAHGITNVHIFESADELRALGVGINIQPSASLILRNLGLLSVMEASGISTQEIIYHNKHGDIVTAEKRGTACGYTIPQLSVHRGEFQMILLDTTKERLGEDCVHVGHTFTHYEQEEGGSKIKAYFSRRAGEPAAIPSFEADVLIAADGINSTMRRLLYPNEGPQHFSGRILWRAAIEWDSFLTGASMVWAGTPDHKFIAYPISAEAQKRGRSLINWICELRVRDADDPDTTPPEKSNWLATVPKERFLPSFEGWEMGGLNVKELVEKTEQIYEYPMCDRNPVDRWHFGRLVLTGDAAHPMYPIGSNGASQAIIDAEALINAVNKFTTTVDGQKSYDFVSALEAFQNERLPPTAKIVMANRANGPDYVLQLAEERAPDGFKNVHDIISQQELDDIAQSYKVLTGYDMQHINKKATDTHDVAEKLGLSAPKKWAK